MTDLSGELCVCGRDRPCYCDKTAVKQGPSAEAGARAEFGTAFSADTDADLRRVIMTVLNAAHGDTFEPHAPTVKRCMDALRCRTPAVPDDFPRIDCEAEELKCLLSPPPPNTLRKAAEYVHDEYWSVHQNVCIAADSDQDIERNSSIGTMLRAMSEAGLCVRAEVEAETIERCAALCDDAAMRATNGIREMAANAIGKAIRALKAGR